MTARELHMDDENGRETWILRGDAQQRALLVRLSGATGPLVRAGSPSDPRFDATRGRCNVRLVVLGVSGDPEVELEYVHRNARHLAGAEWIIVSDDRSEAELATLFDALDAAFIGPPVQAAKLRGAIERALEVPEARDSLRLRRYRDALSERFARWFGDLDLPELLRAMDPQLARIPIVVRGEGGTGRALLACYIHTFGGDAAGGQMPFVELACSPETQAAELLGGVESSAGARSATLFLKDIDQLAPAVATQLRNWIEFGLPPGTRCARHLRWVAALAPESPIERCGDANLLAVLSGLEIRLPPLRSRRNAIDAFVRDTAFAQSETNGRRARDFAADAIATLQHHDWPGNLRELETVVRRSLADSAADPLEARHLKITAALPDLLADTWTATSDAVSPEAETRVEGDDDARHRLDEPVIELRASDLLDDTADDSDDGESDEHDAEARVEWIDAADEPAIAVTWLDAEPLADVAEFTIDQMIEVDDGVAIGREVLRAPHEELDELPSIEVRPIPRGGSSAARAAVSEHPRTLAASSVPNVRHNTPGPESDPDSWRHALSLICDEAQRPVETMRSLAEVFAQNGVPSSYPDVFAHKIAQNIGSARAVNDRLDALAPTAGVSVDASNLLESLLTELRRSISERGVLVLKELDRAQPMALAPAGALRLALRSLLARFVARDRCEASSDLYVASHSNHAGPNDAPTMRILLRHAFSPTDAPAPEITERDLGIELAICDAVARSCGGTLSISEPSAAQIVVVLDLPAPA